MYKTFSVDKENQSFNTCAVTVCVLYCLYVSTRINLQHQDADESQRSPKSGAAPGASGRQIYECKGPSNNANPGTSSRRIIAQAQWRKNSISTTEPSRPMLELGEMEWANPHCVSTFQANWNIEGWRSFEMMSDSTRETGLLLCFCGFCTRQKPKFASRMECH